MPLDPCNCPTTIDGLLRAIYCALFQIAENGAAVNLENITGISDFWKATLGGTPAPDQVFGTDGAGVFTTFDISDGGIALLNPGVPAEDSYIILTAGETVSFQPIGPSLIQNPVTEITLGNGVVTAVS